MLDRTALRAAMLRKLADSGLDEQDLSLLKFNLCTAEEAARWVTRPAGGFVLPYFDLKGNPTRFYRYRYLEQPRQNGFLKAAGVEAKEFRYTQPSNMRPQVYFPPMADWEEFFNDPVEDRHLIITEGENKANCACKMELAVIALGGVANWHAPTDNLPVIPDLESLPLEGRKVYICFDSDAKNNPQVQKQENALARWLRSRKAFPFLARIPALHKNRKTGLDDFLLEKGKAAFQKILAKDIPFGAPELHELNEEVIYLKESSTILELETRLRWRAKEWRDVVYANRHHFEIVSKADKSGKIVNRTEEVSTAAKWVKWDYRSEVETVTYRPGESILVNNEYNTWRGWGLSDEVIKKGDISLWNELINFLIEPKWRHWFTCWLAYPLQNPGAKLFQSVVVWGRVQGTGKTLVGHTMARIYGSNFSEINERHLHSQFNNWAEYKQFIMGDEITGGDKRAAADFLKGLVTQKFIRINSKFVPEYDVPDCINYYFTSNHPDAFFLEDSDRRFAVFEVIGQPLPQEFYRKYDAWYKSDAVGALFYYLLHYDCKDYEPRGHAPVTRAKEEMIVDGKSDLGSWVMRLKQEPDAVLKVGDAPPIQRRMFTTSELLKFYARGGDTRVTENGMSRELKRAGVPRPAEVIATKNGSQRLWIVRDVENLLRLKKPKQFADIYNADWENGAVTKKEKF
jgi:hypothetical protein